MLMRLQISVENRETVITEVFGFRPLGRCLCTTVNLVHIRPSSPRICRTIDNEGIGQQPHMLIQIYSRQCSVQIFITMPGHFYIYIDSIIATSQYDSQFQKQLKMYGLCYEKEFRRLHKHSHKERQRKGKNLQPNDVNWQQRGDLGMSSSRRFDRTHANIRTARLTMASPSAHPQQCK